MTNRYDKLLAGIIILAAFISYIVFIFPGQESGVRVVVEAEGKEVYVFPLGELKAGEQIPITGPLGDSILEMGENRVRLVASPCPDHICLAMGWIDSPGEMIVCLPNRVVVRIEGEGDWDDIAR
ncbi:MAG: NusG domain II-containing protein [Firmicutes bacterium]|nr:NusG domain II-containing protein [Bacillota bacterium]